MARVLTFIAMAFLAGPLHSEPLDLAQAESNRDNSNLEGVRLEDLLLRAIMQRPTEQRIALVSLPDDRVVHVMEGTKIGKNNGVVASITTKEIIISESIPDCGTSKLLNRTTTVRFEEKLPEGTTITFKVVNGKYLSDSAEKS